jgi:hypothetical protein
LNSFTPFTVTLPGTIINAKEMMAVVKIKAAILIAAITHKIGINEIPRRCLSRIFILTFL